MMNLMNSLLLSLIHRASRTHLTQTDPNSIQRVTGHASYMKMVHSLAFYHPVAGSVIRGTDQNMGGVGFESH